MAVKLTKGGYDPATGALPVTRSAPVTPLRTYYDPAHPELTSAPVLPTAPEEPVRVVSASSAAPVYEGPSINRQTGEYVPASVADLEARAAELRAKMYPVVAPRTMAEAPVAPSGAAPSSIFTTKNILIGVGALGALGLVVYLVRRK
jgi:hypothetical protein